MADSKSQKNRKGGATAASASSGAPPSSSKRSNKKQGGNSKPAASPPQEQLPPRSSSPALSAGVTAEHPFLTLLNKKTRSMKKKLEKIKTLETARAEEGKVLNEQQLELVGNKLMMERMLVELDVMREQFVESVLLNKEEPEAESKPKNDAKEQAPEPEAADVPQNEQEANANSDQSEEAPVQQQEEAAEEVEQPIVQEGVQLQVPTAVDEFAHVETLLKALHVVNLYNGTGREVPMVLDFFAKSLLGNTRPLAEISFGDNLVESMEQAKKYLMDSDKVFACETSFKDLHSLVDTLVEEVQPSSVAVEQDEDEMIQELDDQVMEQAEEEADEEVARAAEQIEEEQLVEEIPQFNFFTESQLEPAVSQPMEEEVQEAVGEETQEKVYEETVEEPVEQTEIEQVEQEAEEVAEPAEQQVQTPPEASPMRVTSPAQPSPPKSFAAAAAAVPKSTPGNSVWSNPPSFHQPPQQQQQQQLQPSAALQSTDATDKNQQRRRRYKNNNSPRDGSGNGNNGFKSTRRPRPQRSGEEGGRDFQQPKSNSDRRPRGDRQFRSKNFQQNADGEAVRS